MILRISGKDGLIDKVPNETALYVRIIANPFPVLIKAAQSVASAVRIFRPDKGDLISRALCVAGFVSLRWILHTVNIYQAPLTVICVHWIFRVNVIAFVVSFIFSHTAGVAFKNPVRGNTEAIFRIVRARAGISGLVCQRPDDNRGVIFQRLHHTLCSIQHDRIEFMVRRRKVAVGFDICF